MEASVYDGKYRLSPIPEGGLEIVLDVTFFIAERTKNDDTWKDSLN